MDLTKLIGKLKEIPHEHWERKDEWLKRYTTKIGDYQINLIFSYQQEQIETIQTQLMIISPKNKTILSTREESEIQKMVYNLEKEYIQKMKEERENELNQFLKIL